MPANIAALHHGTHIFTWGRGDLGQLGTGQDQSASQPALVNAVEDKDVAHVAASVYNTAFITGIADVHATRSSHAVKYQRMQSSTAAIDGTL